jgi:pyrrolidone-carboxylate peptidase
MIFEVPLFINGLDFSVFFTSDYLNIKKIDQLSLQIDMVAALSNSAHTYTCLELGYTMIDRILQCLDLSLEELVFSQYGWIIVF